MDNGCDLDTIRVRNSLNQRHKPCRLCPALHAKVSNPLGAVYAVACTHAIIAVTPGGRYFAAGSNAPQTDGLVRGESVLVRYDSAARGVLPRYT